MFDCCGQCIGLNKVALTASMMDGYNIKSAFVIQHEIHERAFGDTMTLLFFNLARSYVMRPMFYRYLVLMRE